MIAAAVSAGDILAHRDEDACIALLSRMVQHESYNQTNGERVLVEFMAGGCGHWALKPS